MSRMQHRRQPACTHRSHAFVACDVDQRLTLRGLGLTARMNAGVEQRQLFDPLRRHAENFQPYTRAHRMARQQEALCPKRLQRQPRHRRNGIHVPEIGNDHFREFAQGFLLRGPDRLVAKQPRQQTDRHLFVSAATPGNSMPDKNASDAPPPVETWLILSATPALLMAFSESPPPTTEIAPDSATAFASATVPLSKGGFSNTPIGPFQMIVFAPLMIPSYSAIVFSPISRPIMPSGIFVTVSCAAPSFSSAATT